MKLPSGVGRERIISYYDEKEALAEASSRWVLTESALLGSLCAFQKTAERMGKPELSRDEEVIIVERSADRYTDLDAPEYVDVRAVMWIHQQIAENHGVSAPAWVVVRPEDST